MVAGEPGRALTPAQSKPLNRRGRAQLCRRGCALTAVAGILQVRSRGCTLQSAQSRARSDSTLCTLRGSAAVHAVHAAASSVQQSGAHALGLNSARSPPTTRSLKLPSEQDSAKRLFLTQQRRETGRQMAAQNGGKGTVRRRGFMGQPGETASGTSRSIAGCVARKTTGPQTLRCARRARPPCHFLKCWVFAGSLLGFCRARTQQPRLNKRPSKGKRAEKRTCRGRVAVNPTTLRHWTSVLT